MNLETENAEIKRQLEILKLYETVLYWQEIQVGYLPSKMASGFILAIFDAMTGIDSKKWSAL